MNKEIEKMAQDIWDALPDYEHNFRDCRDAAKELLTKGYRKSTDVAREIFDAIEEILHKYSRWDMLAYGKHYYTDDDGEIGKGLADLRKKYESEGEDDD